MAVNLRHSRNKFANLYPKFHYSLSFGLTESGNNEVLVKFDVEKFNVDSAYNAGIFFCYHDGFYQFTTTLKNQIDSQEKTKMDILLQKNGRTEIWQHE